MPSENRLKRKTLGVVDDTYSDDQMAERDSAPNDKVLAGLAMAAGVYAAYRKGLLKPIIRTGANVLESFASGAIDKSYQFTSAIKHWSQETVVPDNSIFRGNNLEKFREIVTETLDKKTINTSAIKNIIDDSVTDMNMLNYRIKQRQTNINRLKENYEHTDLANVIKELRIFSREIENNIDNEVSKDTARGLAVQEILTNPKYHLSHEAEQRALKRTGMRSLMLEDILEKPEYDDAGRLILKERIGAPISLYDKDIEGTKTIDLISNIMRGGSHGEYRYFKNGKGTTLAGDWEEFGRTIIDNAIKIDENGNILDLRMPLKMKDAFNRSVVTDFKIPGLGFNPIASLTNWGRTEQNKIFGILSKESYQPFVTGKAGRYALGEMTGGDNMIFIGDKIYAPNNINHGFDLFGEGYVFHDISRAENYGFNTIMRSTIKMADLEDVNIQRKSNRTSQVDDITDTVYKKLRLSREVRDVENYNPDGTRMDPNRLDLEYFTSPVKVFSDKVINPLYAKISPYEKINSIDAQKVFNVKLKSAVNPSTNEVIDARKFIAVKKGMKLSDIEETNGIYGKIDFMKEYLSQAIAGKSTTGDIIGNFTEKTAHIYNTFDTVFDRLGNIAPMLRFENKDKGNLAQYMFNIAAFRIAPIYLATQVPEMLNALSEPIFSVLGFNRRNKKEDKYNDNKMNLGKFIMNDVVKPIDIGFHNVKDMLGITAAAKKFEEFVPASDQITELPVIYQLGLGQTKEERQDYIERGYDPIRKGRFWSMGNQSFTGGKIDYWRPNIYRRVAADVEFSDSKWGSRQEYYSNTWFPNPVNPLAPLNHFLLDRDHYDMKHYYDRPYLMTSAKGENIPLIGHLYAGTIGSLGQKRMHEEYWENNRPVEKNDEAVPIITETRVNTTWTGVTDTTMGPSLAISNPRIISRAFDSTKEQIPGYNKSLRENYITLNRINKEIDADQMAQETAMLQNLQNARQQMMRGKVNTRDIMSENIPIIPATTVRTGGRVSANILPTVTDNTFSTYNQTFSYQYQDAENNVGDLELYTTPSGRMSVVDVPANLDLATANAGVSQYSIRKLIGTNERVQVNDPNRFAPQLTDYSNVRINNSFLYQLGEQYNNTTDVFGMKGFELRTFVTGNANDNARVIENSSYAYSFNKSFWDMNLGGFGGFGEQGDEASEIFRRFVQKRNTTTDYIDPIRNTMPSYMPGRDYFVDYKHGDSYAKIANGEERLPGEGYERLNNINQEEMFNLRIGSSYIGKSEDEMIKHLLGVQEIDLDSTDLPFYGGGSGVSAAESGTKMHEKVEEAWLEAGIAIETEGRVEDEQHNILGFYDAKVRDITSPTGVGIADIKTVNAEKFAAVAQSGQALYEHQSQVNYYLWATGNKRSKGYVYYINRDDPTQTLTVGFNYNPELLRENLETLSNARNRIYEGLQDGTIGRGELYEPLDRLRILADVAPYSQEYEDAKAAVAFSEPNAEEQREISEINDRVKQQKEPLRVYPYKFSNVSSQNLVTEKVQVKEIVDNNHILVKQYGKEHSISFAGINVSQSNSTMYDEDTTMNEAARKQLEKYIKRGREITITYDANNKFNNDSTDSIKSVIKVHGKNVNQIMLNKGFATDKEKDDPASIMATYSNNEIVVGSMLEKITHTFAKIPFIGNKWLQAKSPYEQYRDREVYGKIIAVYG